MKENVSVDFQWNLSMEFFFLKILKISEQSKD